MLRSVNKTYSVLTVYKSIFGKCAAGCSGAGERHGPDPERVQSPWPFSPERFHPGQWHTVGQASERCQDSRGITTLSSPQPQREKNRHEANLCPRCSSLTSKTQPIMTPNLTVFTYIASTLALYSFPILGSLQQCGELLRRECQDDSTLSVLPCVCAIHQGLQGEDTKQCLCIFSYFFTDRVQISLLVRGEVPWFQTWMLSQWDQSRVELLLCVCHRTWRIVRGQITGKASWVWL